jgi:hypothetical protein
MSFFGTRKNKQRMNEIRMQRMIANDMIVRDEKKNKKQRAFNNNRKNA